VTFVTTLDTTGLTPEEYGAVLDKMGVETRPATGIFLHLTTATDFGYRIVEIRSTKEGFEEFLENRLAPASEALGIERKTVISITPLHNFFASSRRVAGSCELAAGHPDFGCDEVTAWRFTGCLAGFGRGVEEPDQTRTVRPDGLCHRCHGLSSSACFLVNIPRRSRFLCLSDTGPRYSK
jgi:hypothetical protein